MVEGLKKILSLEYFEDLEVLECWMLREIFESLTFNKSNEKASKAIKSYYPRDFQDCNPQVEF